MAVEVYLESSNPILYTDWAVRLINIATDPSFEVTSGTTTLRTNRKAKPQLDSTQGQFAGAGGTNTTATTTPPLWTTQYWRSTYSSANAVGVAGFDSLSDPTVPTGAVAYSVYVRTNKQVIVSVAPLNTAATGMTGLVAPNVTVSANVWTRVSFRGTVTTAGALGIRLRAQTALAIGDTFDVGAMLVESANSVLPYFDGAGKPRERENLHWNPSVRTSTTSFWANSVAGANRIAVGDLPGFSWGFGATAPSLAAGAAIGADFPRLTIGATYSLEVWVKNTAAASLTVGWDTGTFNAITLAPSAVRANWTRLSATFTATIDYMYLQLRNTSAVATPATLLMTGILLEEGSLPSGRTFFDGANVPVGYAGAWVSTTNNSVSYITDNDFTATWTGTANNSPSTVTAVNAVGADTANAATRLVYSSTRWASSGTRSVRITPTSATSDPGGARLWTASAGDVGKTFTALVKFRLEAPLTGTLHSQSRRLAVVAAGPSYPFATSATANQAGVYELRLTFSITASGQALHMILGSSLGNGDGWVDDFALVEGAYLGPYFDGSFTDSEFARYDWTGTANASTSTLSTRTLEESPLPAPSSVSEYTVRLEATPVSPTEGSAGSPEFSAGVQLNDVRQGYRQRGRGIAVRDDENRGLIVGVVDGFSTNTTQTVFSALSPLNVLVARVTVPAFRGPFEDFVADLIGLVDPSIPVQFAASLSDKVVAHPAYSDTAWNILNDVCMASEVECVMYEGTVTFRDVRGAAFATDNFTEVDHSYASTQRSEFVEVKWYNTVLTAPTGVQVWPFDPYYDSDFASGFRNVDRQDINIISIGSGETVITDIDLTDHFSLTAISQPVVTDYSGSPTSPPANTSYYRVIDKDNNPVRSTWWADNGGSVRVEIADDGNTIRVFATAPVSDLAPFQLASMSYWPTPSATLVQPRYDLNIYGTGVAMSPETARFHTGANPTEVVQEVGTSIDIPEAYSPLQALSVVQYAMRQYSGPTQSFSATIPVPELIFLAPEWAAIVQDGTMDEDELAEWYQQHLFVSLIGSRIRYGDAYYRIANAEFSAADITIDCVEDTRNYDFETLWDAAALNYGAFEDAVGDMTWEEWEAMPLFIGIGNPYGTGYYGEGVYGE